MKIGVLGAGDIGRILGAGFAGRGHLVKIGSQKPGQKYVREWIAKTGRRISAGSYAEAAAFAETAVLATRWEGTENAIRLADPENLAGKILIDATNPLYFSAGMPPEPAVGRLNSSGEEVQRWLPRTRVVKAFNIVGNPRMIDPRFPYDPPDMFICGNDARAKRTVTGLLEEFGWSVIDIGGIEGSRYLEPLALFWIMIPMNRTNGDRALRSSGKRLSSGNTSPKPEGRFIGAKAAVKQIKNNGRADRGATPRQHTRSRRRQKTG